MSGNRSGGFATTPRSSNGLSTSDKKEFIAWIPAGGAPVAASPESCVRAAANAAGDRVVRKFRNAGGNTPPAATKASSVFATAI